MVAGGKLVGFLCVASHTFLFQTGIPGNTGQDLWVSFCDRENAKDSCFSGVALRGPGRTGVIRGKIVSAPPTLLRSEL